MNATAPLRNTYDLWLLILTNRSQPLSPQAFAKHVLMLWDSYPGCFFSMFVRSSLNIQTEAPRKDFRYPVQLVLALRGSFFLDFAVKVIIERQELKGKNWLSPDPNHQPYTSGSLRLYQAELLQCLRRQVWVLFCRGFLRKPTGCVFEHFNHSNMLKEILLMVQKSGDSPVDMENRSHYLQGFTYLRLLFGISYINSIVTLRIKNKTTTFQGPWNLLRQDEHWEWPNFGWRDVQMVKNFHIFASIDLVCFFNALDSQIHSWFLE